MSAARSTALLALFTLGVLIPVSAIAQGSRSRELRSFVERQGGVGRQYDMVRGNDPTAPKVLTELKTPLDASQVKQKFGLLDHIELAV